MEQRGFDVYYAVIEDTARIGNRRQALDSFYVTLITLLLAGDGWVAGNATFHSYFPAIATAAIGVVGLTITERWRQGIEDIKQILEFRYEWLRRLEATPQLIALGAHLFTDEEQAIYKGRRTNKFLQRTRRVQLIFTTVFIALPLLLAILTTAYRSPDLRPFLEPFLPG